MSKTLSCIDVMRMKREYGGLSETRSRIRLEDIVNMIDKYNGEINELNKLIKKNIPLDKIVAYMLRPYRTTYSRNDIEKAVRDIAVQTIQFVLSKEAKKAQNSQIKWVSTEERLPWMTNGDMERSSSDRLVLIDKEDNYLIGIFAHYHFSGKEIFESSEGVEISLKDIKKWAFIPTPERCNAADY